MQISFCINFICFSIPVFEWYIGSIGNILINGLVLLLYLIIILGIKDQTLKYIQ